MIHHPIIIGTKLVVAVVILVTLLVLRGMLPPEQFRTAVWVAVATFIVLMVAIWVVALKMLANPDSALGKRAVLPPAPKAEDGYTAAPDRFASMVGARGEALSALRPAGTALFDQQRISVVTEGGFIDNGAAVEIISAKGSRVVVRLAKGDDEQG